MLYNKKKKKRWKKSKKKNKTFPRQSVKGKYFPTKTRAVKSTLKIQTFAFLNTPPYNIIYHLSHSTINFQPRLNQTLSQKKTEKKIFDTIKSCLTWQVRIFRQWNLGFNLGFFFTRFPRPFLSFSLSTIIF